MIDPHEAAQAAYWNGLAAEHWGDLQAGIEAVFAPITALALRVAAPALGDRVLDVGCGCGDTLTWKAAIAGLQQQGVQFELCAWRSRAGW